MRAVAITHAVFQNVAVEAQKLLPTSNTTQTGDIRSKW